MLAFSVKEKITEPINNIRVITLVHFQPALLLLLNFFRILMVMFENFNCSITFAVTFLACDCLHFDSENSCKYPFSWFFFTCYSGTRASMQQNLNTMHIEIIFCWLKYLTPRKPMFFSDSLPNFTRGYNLRKCGRDSKFVDPQTKYEVYPSWELF